MSVRNRFVHRIGQRRMRRIHIRAADGIVRFNQFSIGIEHYGDSVAVGFDFALIRFRVYHHDARRVAPCCVFKHFELRFRRARGYGFHTERISVDGKRFVDFSVAQKQRIRGVVVHAVTRCDYQRFAVAERS